MNNLALIGCMGAGLTQPPPPPPRQLTWTARLAPASWCYAIAYGNDRFVSVGSSLMKSLNGTTWTTATSGPSGWWRAVVFANGRFVSVGSSGSRAMVSSDGVTWSARTCPIGAWGSLATNGSIFVALALNSTSPRGMTSPDGDTWTALDLPGSESWSGITYANGLFVAVSTDNVIMTSPDGFNWTKYNPNGDFILHLLQYLFVIWVWFVTIPSLFGGMIAQFLMKKEYICVRHHFDELLIRHA